MNCRLCGESIRWHQSECHIVFSPVNKEKPIEYAHVSCANTLRMISRSMTDKNKRTYICDI